MGNDLDLERETLEMLLRMGRVGELGSDLHLEKEDIEVAET